MGHGLVVRLGNGRVRGRGQGAARAGGAQRGVVLAGFPQDRGGARDVGIWCSPIASGSLRRSRTEPERCASHRCGHAVCRCSRPRSRDPWISSRDRVPWRSLTRESTDGPQCGRSRSCDRQRRNVPASSPRGRQSRARLDLAWSIRSQIGIGRSLGPARGLWLVLLVR